MPKYSSSLSTSEANLYKNPDSAFFKGSGYLSLMINRSEIESLVYLLSDPDEFVQASVMNRFDNMGDKSVPLLDEIRASTREPNLRQKLDNLILKLTFPSIELEFLNLIEGGLPELDDLERGVLLLGRLDNPTFREELYVRKLDAMASEIASEVNYTLQPLSQMEILMEHIFGAHGFKPAGESYYDTDFAHFHKVMDGKMGIPLTLAMIVLFVARRLELPFNGVNMPIHFLMRFDFDTQVVYLDPYNQGRPVTLNECLGFLKKHNIRPEQEHFETASPASMLGRALRNLQNSYTRKNDLLRSSMAELLLTHHDLISKGSR